MKKKLLVKFCIFRFDTYKERREIKRKKEKREKWSFSDQKFQKKVFKKTHIRWTVIRIIYFLYFLSLKEKICRRRIFLILIIQYDVEAKDINVSLI